MPPPVSNYSAPSIRSIPGAPKNSDWADAFIAPRDAQIKLLTSSLQVSTESLGLDLVTVPFLADTPVAVRSKKIRGAIAGALLVCSSDDDPDQIVVTPSPNIGEIIVEALFLTAPANPVPVRLLLLGL